MFVWFFEGAGLMLAFEWQQNNTFWELYFRFIEELRSVIFLPQNDNLLILKWSFQLQNVHLVCKTVRPPALSMKLTPGESGWNALILYWFHYGSQSTLIRRRDNLKKDFYSLRRWGHFTSSKIQYKKDVLFILFRSDICKVLIRNQSPLFIVIFLSFLSSGLRRGCPWQCHKNMATIFKLCKCCWKRTRLKDLSIDEEL